MRINIEEFFVTQDLRKIKKTLKFASLHCSPEQRKNLLEEMRKASQARKDAMDSLKALELKRIELLNPFFGNRMAYQASAFEVQLLKQREKIMKSIAILEEVWQA